MRVTQIRIISVKARTVAIMESEICTRYPSKDEGLQVDLMAWGWFMLFASRCGKPFTQGTDVSKGKVVTSVVFTGLKITRKMLNEWREDFGKWYSGNYMKQIEIDKNGITVYHSGM